MLEALGIAGFFLLIMASIALHEIGHLIPAKRFGVRVPEYMVGFGPTVVSWRRGETRYGVKAIPLGGYIRMIGMLPPASDANPDSLRSMTTGRAGAFIQQARKQSFDEIGPGDDKRLFYKLPPWKRIIIMLGGPMMNLLLAVLFFTIVLSGIGIATANTTIERVAPCLPSAVQMAETGSCPAGESAAALAGLQPGDRIVALNGQEVGGWPALLSSIQESGGQTISIEFVRDGANRSVEVAVPVASRPVLDELGRETGSVQQVGYLGVQPAVNYERQSLTLIPRFMWEMTARSVEGIISLPVRLYELVTETLISGGERSADSPISVVGASRIGGEVVASPDPLQDKAAMFLSLLASINLFLFLFNLLPFLPLDGGHVAGAFYESLRKKVAKVLGRPDPGYADISKLLPVTYVAAALLIFVGGIVIFADLVRPLSLT